MKDNLIAVFSGSGIGLLIGMLMGLAVSPVVGVIIGALASSLALILGLNEKHVSALKSIRIGAFGFACVAGACVGIFIRAHNLLSPDLEDLKQQYLGLGYHQDQALAFIAYKEFGILDKNWRISAPAGEVKKDKKSSGKTDNGNGSGVAIAALTEKQHKSNLYGSKISFSACRDLAGTTTALPPMEIANNFMVAGGFWDRLAQTATTFFPEEDWAAVLLLVRDGICAEDEKLFFSQVAAHLPKPGFTQRHGRQEILQGFRDSGGPLERLADRVDKHLPQQLHKTVLLMIQKELGHDNQTPAL